MEQSSMLFQKDGKNYLQLDCEKQIYTVYLVFTWIYRKAAANFQQRAGKRSSKGALWGFISWKPDFIS